MVHGRRAAAWSRSGPPGLRRSAAPWAARGPCVDSCVGRRVGPSLNPDHVVRRKLPVGRDSRKRLLTIWLELARRVRSCGHDDRGHDRNQRPRRRLRQGPGDPRGDPRRGHAAVRRGRVPHRLPARGGLPRRHLAPRAAAPLLQQGRAAGGGPGASRRDRRGGLRGRRGRRARLLRRARESSSTATPRGRASSSSTRRSRPRPRHPTTPRTRTSRTGTAGSSRCR